MILAILNHRSGFMARTNLSSEESSSELETCAHDRVAALKKKKKKKCYLRGSGLLHTTLRHTKKGEKGTGSGGKGINSEDGYTLAYTNI
jgi:hypothetical protein